MTWSTPLPSNGSCAGCRAAVIVAAVLATSIAAPLAAAESAEQQARADSNRAKVAYDLGRFEEALQAYSEAYEHKPLPGFLFNIAQCHKQLGNCERANFFYRRYLTVAPSVKDPAAVEKLIQECEAKLAEQQRLKDEQAALLKQQQEAERARLALAAASQAASSAPAVAQEDPPVYQQWWFWTSIGVAAVVVAAGAGTTALVLSQPATTPPTLGSVDLR